MPRDLTPMPRRCLDTPSSQDSSIIVNSPRVSDDIRVSIRQIEAGDAISMEQVSREIRAKYESQKHGLGGEPIFAP